MSFWDDIDMQQSGNPGTQDKFDVLPDGTTALAVLEGVELKTWEDNESFSLTWRIVDGEFAKRVVWQTLDIFNRDNIKRAARHKGLLAKMYEVTGVPRPTDRPSVNDILKLQGKLIGLKIREFPRVDERTNEIRNSNWIESIHANEPSFLTKSGVKMDTRNATMVPAKQAKPAAPVTPDFNDDIPF